MIVADELVTLQADDTRTCQMRNAAESPAMRRAGDAVAIPLARSTRIGRRVQRTRPTPRGADRGALRRAIVHLTAEYQGYARTGGLAEAVAGLAASQVRAGERVYVFVPLYAVVREVAPKLEPLTPSHAITLGGRSEQVRFFRDAARTEGPQLIFVEVPGSFDRPGLYGDGSGDYPDNHVRFALFARAALHGIATLVPGPVLLHAHDWHAALAPVYMRTHPEDAPRFGDTPTVLSVHNAGYQGHFGAEAMADLALSPDLWHMDRMEWYGKLNLLKGGLAYCDAAVTVSPAHAEELRTDEGGFGLHHVFRTLGTRLVGICNGIELRHWDPTTDPHIAAAYSRDDLKGKAVCKDALQRAFGLPRRPRAPVIGMSSRLAGQKGFDIVLRSARLRDTDAQLIVIGEGEAHIRDAVARFAAECPERVACCFTFTDRLEHQLMAGADLVLMPSQYEPCGLTQMHAQRYGVPVIGRRVGGIGDTVADGKTGFLFDAFDPTALDGAIDRALALYADRAAWQAMMRRAMACDFGWDQAMVDYAEVYRTAERGAAAHLTAL